MTQILFRRGTAATASSNNPVLAAGEPGWEEDTRTFKIGDGVTAWRDLPPIAGGGGGATVSTGTSAPTESTPGPFYIQTGSV